MSQNLPAWVTHSQAPLICYPHQDVFFRSTPIFEQHVSVTGNSTSKCTHLQSETHSVRLNNINFKRAITPPGLCLECANNMAKWTMLQFTCISRANAHIGKAQGHCTRTNREFQICVGDAWHFAYFQEPHSLGSRNLCKSIYRYGLKEYPWYITRGDTQLYTTKSVGTKFPRRKIRCKNRNQVT